MLQRTAAIANTVGSKLNWTVERLCALLVAVMVLIIWWGVISRYFLGEGGVWTEELSRYVMIWAALLAVPVCAYRREHIGLEILFQYFPEGAKPWARLGLDLIGLAFFLFLFVYGIGMTEDGAQQYATIFGMTMMVPFASVPACAGLTSIQIIVLIIRDLAYHHGPGASEPPGESWLHIEEEGP